MKLGGNGSYKGAKIFSEEFNIPVIGIPATIDNDISGFATLSGTGHPHVLQFIFANQTITQISVAFCQEVG